ncbi:Small ubiquitin-related modifier 3 [Myotis davidii]|uniref:Small ubiquitin-related modifier 3 n=1 Tax=Myotis davidii TaxID=225400 RepID=L5M6D8_MYODS|nr:Small ubiquitin-related modifier 3 [Myotis davidii]
MTKQCAVPFVPAEGAFCSGLGEEGARAPALPAGREGERYDSSTKPAALARSPVVVSSSGVAPTREHEGVKTENDHISLKVAGQDGSVVQFKIKRHTPLSKLMKAYCERQGLSMRQIRFRFDGQPINEADTPAQV